MSDKLIVVQPLNKFPFKEQKGRYCVHQKLSLVPVIKYINLLHILPMYFNMRFNNILPTASGSSDLPQSIRFFFQNFVCISHPSPT